MPDTTIETFDFHSAADLGEVLGEIIRFTSLHEVYVIDAEGRNFTRAELIEYPLSDGSNAYNLVLLPMAGEN